MGSNGDDHWVVPPFGPVSTGRQPDAVQQLLIGERGSLPFLQLATVLEKLDDRYELTLHDGAEPPPGAPPGSPPCLQVTGTRKDTTDPLLPTTVQVWTTRKTGVCYRLEAVWEDQPLTPRRLTFQWLSLDAPVTDAWYHHASHHPPFRPVIRRSDEPPAAGPASSQP
jgi:hypothetical protein